MTLRIGQKIGPYKLIAELGRGGMGMVYKAHGRGKDVALKVILPATADNRAKRYFMQEATVTRQLKHPNVIRHYEHGTEKRLDIEYLALEFAPAGSLHDYIYHRIERNNPISPRECVTLLRKMASGLDYIHSREVIHRDLKPGNILMIDESTPKIADFGLAKAKNDKLSVGSMGMGSLLYMAPEQMGDSYNVKPAADIYAIVSVAYHMLTGYPPYDPSIDKDVAELGVVALVAGPNQIELVQDGKKQIKEFFGHVQLTPPILPSIINTKLSTEVDGVILKGLSNSPDERYSSASEFVQDLSDGIERRSTLAGEGQNEVIDLDATISDKERRTWNYAGRANAVKVQELSIYVIAAAAIFGAGKAIHDFATKDEVQKERFRVYRDVSDFIVELFNVTKAEAYVLTLEMIENSGNMREYFPPNIPKPNRTTDVEQVTKIIRSIRLTYENNRSWKVIPARLDVYSVEDGEIVRRTVTRELRWGDVPTDIRRELTDLNEDSIMYKLYP